MRKVVPKNRYYRCRLFLMIKMQIKDVTFVIQKQKYSPKTVSFLGRKIEFFPAALCFSS